VSPLEGWDHTRALRPTRLGATQRRCRGLEHRSWYCRTVRGHSESAGPSRFSLGGSARFNNAFDVGTVDRVEPPDCEISTIAPSRSRSLNRSKPESATRSLDSNRRVERDRNSNTRSATASSNHDTASIEVSHLRHPARRKDKCCAAPQHHDTFTLHYSMRLLPVIVTANGHMTHDMVNDVALTSSVNGPLHFASLSRCRLVVME
jgi:hypothetical protein